ncbi:hypothetical protein D3C74_498920 [compost metagenome]
MVRIQIHILGSKLNAYFLVDMAFQILQQRFEAFSVLRMPFILMPVSHLLRREGAGQQGEE